MNHNASIHFDTDQTPLAVAVACSGIAPSISGEYLRIHLPSGANPAKTVIHSGPCDVPVDVELLYDQPAKTALVEALVTAGASTYDVSARAQIGQSPLEGTGKTGTAIPLSLAWG